MSTIDLRRREPVSIVTWSSRIPHGGTIAEVAETLLHSFVALGYSAHVLQGTYGHGMNVVFSTALARESLPPPPPHSVVFNLEQFDAQSSWFPPQVRTAMSEHVVWDYSARNLRNLQAAGVISRGYHLPIGYVPELARIAPSVTQDIDVLFYGSVNRRRGAILQALAKRGLRVVRAFNVYGARRDALIARAKLVLNLHYYDVRVFEIVRVSYLWTNRKAVLTEEFDDEDVGADLREGLAIGRGDELADLAEHLVADERARRTLEERGFEAFRRHPQAPMLAAVLAQLPR